MTSSLSINGVTLHKTGLLLKHRNDSLYLVTNNNPVQCLYLYNPLTPLSIYYDPRNGQVITDSAPDSELRLYSVNKIGTLIAKLSHYYE